MREKGWQSMARGSAVLGFLSWVPCLAPVAVPLALAGSLSCWFWSRKHPEGQEVRRTALLGLCAVLVGVVLLFAEAHAFLTWKRDEARAQARAISEIRMRELASGLEAYRSRNGSYPPARSASELCGLLVPTYLPRCPDTDGWGRPIQVWCDGRTYRIWALPLTPSPQPANPATQP